MARTVIHIRRTRIMRNSSARVGYGRLVQKNGTVYGLGWLGLVRISHGPHRIMLNQPVYKRL